MAPPSGSRTSSEQAACIEGLPAWGLEWKQGPPEHLFKYGGQAYMAKYGINIWKDEGGGRRCRWAGF